MSVRSATCLRNHLLRPAPSPLRAQRRWARVHDIRFVAAQRHNSSIQEKYGDKLEQKARDEGFESVEHLKAAYRERLERLRKRVSDELAKATSPEAQAEQSQEYLAQQQQARSQSNRKGPVFQQPPPPLPQPQSIPQSPSSTASTTSSSSKSSGTPSGAPGIKPLSSYLDLEKASALPAKELEYIWRLRFASDPLSLCAVVPLDTYKRIYTTSRQHPRFILPLPRPAADDGSNDIAQNANGFGANAPRIASDIHFLQWGFHPPAGLPPAPGSNSENTHTSTVLFTHLAAFKLHGEFATPHTVVTHHLDLADSHGLVLLNGAVTKGGGVSVEEAKWLLLCLQKFYDQAGHGGGVGKEKRQDLLKKFTQGDTSFKLEELVDEAERIS